MKYSVDIKVASFHAYRSLDIFKYTCPLPYYGRDNLFFYILVLYFHPYCGLYLDQVIKLFVNWATVIHNLKHAFTFSNNMCVSKELGYTGEVPNIEILWCKGVEMNVRT